MQQAMGAGEPFARRNVGSVNIEGGDRRLGCK